MALIRHDFCTSPSEKANAPNHFGKIQSKVKRPAGKRSNAAARACHAKGGTGATADEAFSKAFSQPSIAVHREVGPGGPVLVSCQPASNADRNDGPTKSSLREGEYQRPGRERCGPLMQGTRYLPQGDKAAGISVGEASENELKRKDINGPP